MNILQSIILGAVQGVGEFLPISSSAHLILVPFLFDFNINMNSDIKLAFDVALHLGTLIAVLFVFYKDFLNIVKGFFKGVFKKEKTIHYNMFWYLVIATIPGALAGLFLSDVIKDVFRSNELLIATALGIMGLLLYLVDKWAEKKYEAKEVSYEKITLKQSLVIGVSQAFAVIPGFSRSGTTIMTGRYLGLSREAAARFTFLLSAPIIAGAAVMEIPELTFTTEVIFGIVTSAVVGVLTIKFLLNYIKKNDFALFGIYRVIVMLLVFIKFLL